MKYILILLLLTSCVVRYEQPDVCYCHECIEKRAEAKRTVLAERAVIQLQVDSIRRSQDSIFLNTKKKALIQIALIDNELNRQKMNYRRINRRLNYNYSKLLELKERINKRRADYRYIRKRRITKFKYVYF